MASHVSHEWLQSSQCCPQHASYCSILWPLKWTARTAFSAQAQANYNLFTYIWVLTVLLLSLEGKGSKCWREECRWIRQKIFNSTGLIEGSEVGNLGPEVSKQKCIFKVSWRKEKVLDSKEAGSINWLRLLWDQSRCGWLGLCGLFFLQIGNWGWFNMWGRMWR